MAGPGRLGELTASDGTGLRYRVWEPAAARAAVLVVPGLGEHSGRYAALAQPLNSRDVSLFSLDVRGHGLSGGRRGHVRRFGDYLLDVDAALTEARSRVAGGPVILFGHSMGGLIALRFAQSRPGETLAGLVLSAPQLAIASPPPPWLRRAARVLSVIAPALPLPNGIDAEDLSHDREEIQAYRDDPLVHDRITPRLFGEMGRAMDQAMRETAAVQVPAALVILPGADPVVVPDAGREMAARLAAVVPTEVREYPEMYHEPLHETERATVIADLVGWILPRAA